MLFVLLFALLQDTDADLYHVVLTNKKVMKVQAPPDCQGRLCRITLANGEITSLPAAMIDQAATEELNQRLADERARALEEQAAAEAAEAELRAKRQALIAKKNVVLEIDDELPQYERPPNTQATTTGQPDAEPVAPPISKDFTSNNPVYVSRETLTRYADRTEVVAVVTVQSTTGAEEIQVTLKVNYDVEAADTFTRTISRAMAMNESETLTFTLAKTDQVTKTAYEVTASIPSLP